MRFNVTFRVLPAGGPAVTLELDQPTSIRDALAHLGIALDGRQITVNGIATNDAHVLRQGDQVTLRREIKGA